MASLASPCFPSPAHCSPSPSIACTTAPSSIRSTTAFLSPSYRRVPLPGVRRFPPGATEPFICRCQNPSDAGGLAPRRWDQVIHDAVKSAAKRWDDCLRSVRGSLEKVAAGASAEQRDGAGSMEEDAKDGEWDWERWKRHFVEVEEHKHIVSVLKSQLNAAVYREDYRDAAKLKRAIAAVVANDAVGSAIKNLNIAVKQEHYDDAISIRDHAGTGLVGWWTGISEDSSDPYGRIIRITAEHGKYVARSYSPRQLATGRSGFPLFEVYFTVGSDGEYKHQAVYLKSAREFSRDLEQAPKNIGVDSSSPTSGSEETEVSVKEDLDVDDGADDPDAVDGFSGVQNVLDDMIPGVKFKILKVISPETVGQDMMSDVNGHIVDEEEEESESESESELEEASDDEEYEDEDDANENDDEEYEDEDDANENDDEEYEDEDDANANDDEEYEDEDDANENDDDTDENDDDTDEIEIEFVTSEDGMEIELESEESELGAEDTIPDITSGQSDLSFGFVVDKSYVDLPPINLVRVPARLEKKGRSSFSFSVQDSTQIGSEKEQNSSVKAAKHSNLRSPDLIMADLAKALTSKEKISIKVLKDVVEMIKFTLNESRSNRPLCGTMFFNRIELTPNSDPLSGLYISAHGVFDTEVLNLRHKFGQWKEDDENQTTAKLEFYEYVEALKLTGDPSVPAGQVAFRAKVGKQYQLPHKGFIPEEFGVIARYKGQGRLAEPGFRNPRWVDGELVILDGKHIRGGPIIGFFYWGSEYNYLMFLKRLKFPE